MKRIVSLEELSHIDAEMLLHIIQQEGYNDKESQKLWISMSLCRYAQFYKFNSRFQIEEGLPFVGKTSYSVKVLPGSE